LSYARRVLAGLGRTLCAAVAATVAGAFAASRFGSAVPGLAAGSLTVVAVFVLFARALNVQGVASALRSVRTVTRRLPYARFR
jgi:putative peptidoglycan lipid II flippase